MHTSVVLLLCLLLGSYADPNPNGTCTDDKPVSCDSCVACLNQSAFNTWCHKSQRCWGPWESYHKLSCIGTCGVPTQLLISASETIDWRQKWCEFYNYGGIAVACLIFVVLSVFAGWKICKSHLQRTKETYEVINDEEPHHG